ncbi:MAG TPA: hypothetical protein VK325_03690 [Pseudoxanthomonas sp.]|nr:hypothetical protein [Pseudoxanthomonas sp.]
MLHAVVPLAVAVTFFRRRWRSPYLWMLAGWPIASTTYGPIRSMCLVAAALAFILHRPPAILFYASLLMPRRSGGDGPDGSHRPDALDCVWMHIGEGAIRSGNQSGACAGSGQYR